MHRCAAQHAALAVVEIAVGGIRLEELRDLVDEPLEHRLDLELAAQDLRGAQQRRLLPETLAVLGEESGEPDREPGLGGDRLDEEHGVPAPGARRVAMRREHADRAIPHDDRRRDDGACAERTQLVEPSEGVVLELRGLVEIRDDDGGTGPRRQIRDGQPACPVAERPRAGGVPLRKQRQRAVGVAEPYEAARRAERAPRFLDGRGERGVEIELGAQAPRDPREQPLARKRFAERARRARALERDRSLGREGLHDPEILGREDTRRIGRRDGDHRDHAVVADQRHERGALRPDVLRERPAHPGRARDVVDGEARRVAHRARDAGRLVLQVDADGGPPVDVLAVAAREEARAFARVVRDERERGEADVEERSDLVEERAGDALDVRRAGELRRDPAETLELALPLGRDRDARRGPGRAGAEEGAGGQPDREGDEERSDALPRERETVEADGKRLDRGHAGRGDCTERRPPRKPDFPAGSRYPCAFKRWAVRPIVRV